MEGAKQQPWPSHDESSANLPFSVARLEQYVNGAMPKRFALPWNSVAKVYLPWNLKGNHWVLVQLDLAGRTVVVYDSNIKHIDSKELGDLLCPLIEGLPKLLQRANFYSNFKSLITADLPFDKLYATWKHKRLQKNIPQQTDGYGASTEVCFI